MKSKRTFFMILVFAMALLMFSTSCGNRTSPEESKSSDTPLTEVKEPADTTSEPTSEPETPSTAADKTQIVKPSYRESQFSRGIHKPPLSCSLNPQR